MRVKLLLLITLYCNIALSQNYLNSTSKWYELRGDRYDNWWERSTFYINGDSIIDNKTYYKLIQDYDYFKFPTGDIGSGDTLQFLEGLSKLHFIREDSAKFYKYQNANEHLIIDFDLEVGDTIVTMNNYETILEVDTIEILGVERKVFKTSNWNKIYEGIGTNRGGILRGVNHLGDEGVGSLFCYSIDNASFEFDETWSYPHIGMDNCSELITDITDDLHGDKVDIYPNPANHLINVKTNLEFNKAEISLFDINGNLCLKESFRNEMQIDISNLSNGIYFLILIRDGDYFYEKVIVSK